MLFKVVRENETTYYVPEHIRKISISPVYGKEDIFDVALYLDTEMEIVHVCHSFEKAERFVSRLYELMNISENRIVDLNKDIQL